MALTYGTKLGPYEIQSPLGAGSMGEVYRARDTRLNREVAVKILPSHLSDNSEAKQRFDREARAISSLNHPNICTLHDVGRQGGVEFLVMELLDGETLAQRLVKGPLPLEQVLKYGIEICEGLEKARRSGVLHRDLKPRQHHGHHDRGQTDGLWTRQGEPCGESAFFRHYYGYAGESVWRQPSHREGHCGGDFLKRTRRPIFLLWARCCTRWQRGSARSGQLFAFENASTKLRGEMPISPLD
jgi:hypothetical protein